MSVAHRSREGNAPTSHDRECSACSPTCRFAMDSRIPVQGVGEVPALSAVTSVRITKRPSLSGCASHSCGREPSPTAPTREVSRSAVCCSPPRHVAVTSGQGAGNRTSRSSGQRGLDAFLPRLNVPTRSRRDGQAARALGGFRHRDRRRTPARSEAREELASTRRTSR